MAELHRRWVRRLCIGGPVFLLLWCAAAGLVLVGSVNDAQAGKRVLEHARTRQDPMSLLRGEGSDDLRKAEQHFQSAERRAGSFLVAPFDVLPVFGRQVRSLRALSGAGADVMSIGAEALEDMGRRLSDDTSTGASRVATVEGLTGVIDRAQADLNEVDLGPSEALVEPLSEARSTFTSQMSEIHDGLVRARALSKGLEGFLTGPRRYLVLAANNAEMQAGWGMPLEAGVLSVEDGDLELVGTEPTSGLRLPPQTVALEGDFAENWGFLSPNEEWRNLALTPRFDQTGPLAAEMWAARGYGSVDGVLALDPLALRGILAATGPVNVNGRQMSADNVVHFALHDQYALQGPGGESRDERKEGLSAIAVAAVEALRKDFDSVSLIEGLVEAARGRHLLAWSSVESDQAAWEASRMDGALTPDSLLLSLINRGGNKLDWFVDVEGSLTAEPGPGDKTAIALRTTMSNRTPEGESSYVAGPSAGSGAVAAGDYIGFLTVNLPAAASNGRIEGVDQLVVAGPAGPTRLVGTQVRLPRNESIELVVRFELPSWQEELRIEPTARVRRVFWSMADQSWADDARHTVRVSHLHR